MKVFFAFLLLGIFSGALSAPMDMEQNNTNLELISELFDEMSMNDSVVEVEDLKFLDRSYGKNWIKLLYVERNGNIHSIREYEVSSLITLDNVKEYKLGDNTNVIATDSQKNTVYLLAKKFGVGTPEQFAILVAQHYIETYPWVIRADITVEALRWSRIRENHVHAFVAEPTFTRWGKATLKRKNGMPKVTAGLRGLRLLKTTQSGFVNLSTTATEVSLILLTGLSALLWILIGPTVIPWIWIFVMLFTMFWMPFMIILLDLTTVESTLLRFNKLFMTLRCKSFMLSHKWKKSIWPFPTNITLALICPTFQKLLEDLNTMKKFTCLLINLQVTLNLQLAERI